MEVDVQPTLAEEPMNDSRNFGSNYHPSSQSRKISIGVIVDSLAKIQPGCTKKDETTVPNTEMLNSNVGNNVEAKNKDESITAATKEKQTEAPGCVTSPWVKTRSFCQKTPTSETFCAKQNSSLAGKSRWQKKLNGVKHAPVTYSVQFFANKTSILQCSDSKEKKGDGITYKRKRGKERSQKRLEEFTIATAQEVLVSGKTVMEDKADKTENRSTETLRMKLWEILANVTSQKSRCSNSQACEVDANNLSSDQIFHTEADKLVKPRENSDTIETDSEGPNCAIRRPVTRSLSRKRAPIKPRKRAPIKLLPSKTKCGSSSSYKERHQENNIFSFEERLLGKHDVSGSLDSSESKRKKIQRKNTLIKPHKICFSEKDDSDETQREPCKSEMLPPNEKASSLGNKIGSIPSCPPENKSHFLEPQNTIFGKHSHLSLVTNKRNQLDDLDSPSMPQSGNKQENIGDPPFRNVTDQQDDFESPTFEMRIPILSPSPRSIPETVQELSDFSAAPEERIFTMGNIRSFRNLETSEQACDETDAQQESADELGKLKDYSVMEPSPCKLRKDAEDDLTESFSVEDSDSSEEGHRKRETSLPNNTLKKLNFMVHPTERVGIPKDIGVDESVSPSLEGTHESECFMEPSEQNQEDGLGRAVTLFALALENFERKLKSAAQKKSSEILMSVSDGIQLQLLNFESQIQTDLGKLSSICKSKRKHLETRFQEQQEQLGLMHEKFKEEISRHLQECRIILEGLEAHQIQLKGTLKKQKASQHKLLLQVEEAVETQLSDAQRRVTAVNELATGKMLQLKRIIAECLKEGVLN